MKYIKCLPVVVVVIVIGLLSVGSSIATVNGLGNNTTTSTPDPIFLEVQQLLGIDPEEQKARDEAANAREEAQIKQWNIDEQRKANGSMPICKEGENPLTNWSKSLVHEDVIKGISPVTYESCMEPEPEFKGAAIILFK